MNPWDKYKKDGTAPKSGNPWDRYGKQTTADFTKGKGGLYRMLPASDKGFTNTSDEIRVPFSRVEDALKGGYHLHPDEQQRYGNDKAHPKAGPTLLERANSKVEELLQPSSGEIGQMPIAPSGFDVNAAKAAGRVVYGMPGFLKDLATAFYTTATGKTDSSAILDQIDPGKVPEQLQQQFHEDMKTDPKRAIDNLAGTLAGMGLIGAATHGASKVLPEMARAAVDKPVEHLRTGIRETLGVAENTEKNVKKFGKQAETTRARNREAAQQHSEKTQDALHATRGAELKAEAERRLAQSKAEEANAAAAKKHLEETQEALHKTKGEELKAEQENKAKKIEALKKTQAQEKAHQAEVAEVKAHNDAVMRDRAKRAETQEKLDSSSKELDDKIDAAGQKAKAEDDAAWDAWRAKVGNTQVNMQPVVDEIKAQEDKMNPQQVAEFRDIVKNAGGGDELDQASQQAFGANYSGLTPEQKAVIDDDFAQRGVTPGGGADTPVSRLHGWKTQLEDAVRSDRAGNIKYAIGQVLDAVRKLEEQVSKEAGADPELKKARALHGPYVDTFRNSQTTPGTVANYVRAKVTPNFTKDAKLEDYIAKLGEFDPSIPKLVEHIDNLETGLKALPKDQPLREQLKELPSPPERVPPPALKVPERAEVPNRPAVIEPEPVRAPERVAPPDRPEEIPAPETPNIQAQNVEYIDKGLRKYGKVGSWVLRIIAGGLAEHMAHGNLSAFGGELLIGQGAVTLMTRALRSPRVLDWLAKPSAEDMKMIATLPAEDAAKLREALNGLAEEDKRRDPAASNIKLAPLMAAFLSGGKAAPPPNPQDLRKQAEQLKPTPAPPGPQSLSAKPYTHIYDPARNVITAV